MKGKSVTLVNLQIARFFAALSVAMVHIQHEIPKARLSGYEHFSQMLWFPWGMGVDLFFVLSGFVMILTSSKLTGGGADARSFLRRRLERVTPMYWIFTVLMICAMIGSGERSEVAAYHVLASLFYIPVPGPTGQINPVLGVGWTINYEMFFYAVFAASLLLPVKKSRQVLIFVMVGLVALGAVAPQLPQPLFYWTRPILLEFVVGCGIGLLYLRGKELTGAVSFFLISVGFALFFAASALGIAEGQTYRWWCLGIPASLIVVALALSRQLPDHGVARLLHQLGDSSYALYLVHPFVIVASAMVWKRLGMPSVAAFVAFALSGSVIASYVVHKLIEKPVSKLLKDLPYAFSKSRNLAEGPVR